MSLVADEAKTKTTGKNKTETANTFHSLLSSADRNWPTKSQTVKNSTENDYMRKI